MPPQAVIIHERVARWSRQLRPRFSGWPICWSETRTGASLVAAVARYQVPILIIELDDHPARRLNDLAAAITQTPSALALVIEPPGRPEVAELARELGATIVLSGVVIPPQVETLLHRWLTLASDREQSGGWSPSQTPEPKFWERPEFLAIPSQPTTP